MQPQTARLRTGTSAGTCVRPLIHASIMSTHSGGMCRRGLGELHLRTPACRVSPWNSLLSKIRQTERTYLSEYDRPRPNRLCQSPTIVTMTAMHPTKDSAMPPSSFLASNTPSSLPRPGMDGYDDLPQFPAKAALPFRRTIRREELHQIVPLAQTTIYAMEQRGEFPRRFRRTERCVVWDLEEVEAWIESRKQASRSTETNSAPGPDVKLRRYRPVR